MKRYRSLRPGEQIPEGEPYRYPNDRGYIRLRWKIGPKQYVECYEHRVIDGRVTTAEHVHHMNHVRDDNRPENLEHLTQAEHSERHASEVEGEAVRLYLAGHSTLTVGERVGITAGAVSRLLARCGVTARPNSAYYPDVDLDRLRSLHASGVKMGPMARELGVGHTRVRDALIDLGLPLPGPGRPRKAVA